jgi:hypothetical protein
LNIGEISEPAHDADSVYARGGSVQFHLLERNFEKDRAQAWIANFFQLNFSVFGTRAGATDTVFPVQSVVCAQVIFETLDRAGLRGGYCGLIAACRI